MWRAHSCEPRPHFPETLELRQSVHHCRVATNTSREIHPTRVAGSKWVSGARDAPDGVAWRSWGRVFRTAKTRSHECERGTHECVRHKLRPHPDLVVRRRAPLDSVGRPRTTRNRPNDLRPLTVSI